MSAETFSAAQSHAPSAAGTKKRPEAARAEARRDLLVIGAMFHGVLVVLIAAEGRWVIYALVMPWLSLSMAMSAFTILHHGGHGRFSPRPWVNALAVHLATPLGYYVRYWGLKHRIHHAAPTVYPRDGYTSGTSLLRLHPAAPVRRWHRFQQFYIWLGYLSYWFVDQIGQIGFLLKGGIPYSRVQWSVSRRVTGWLAEKLASCLILCPYVIAGGWHLITLLIVCGAFASLVAGAVVGVGHINEGLKPLAASELRQNWSNSVVGATASFSVDSRLSGWLFGGMTTHAAHHLRPIATRAEMRQLTHQLRRAGAEGPGSRLVEFSSFFSAVKGHVSTLTAWGRREPN
jgi:linoleoyl-CoA desaturase